VRPVFVFFFAGVSVICWARDAKKRRKFVMAWKMVDTSCPCCTLERTRGTGPELLACRGSTSCSPTSVWSGMMTRRMRMQTTPQSVDPARPCSWACGRSQRPSRRGSPVVAHVACVLGGFSRHAKKKFKPSYMWHPCACIKKILCQWSNRGKMQGHGSLAGEKNESPNFREPRALECVSRHGELEYALFSVFNFGPASVRIAPEPHLSLR
jgi:hypothetical protein